PTCDILKPHEPHGPRETPARSPSAPGSAIADLTSDQFLKPFAMMLPRPTASHLATRHGADSAAQPDCRVNVYDPHTDDGHGGKRVDEHRPPLLLYAGQRIEILVPDDDAGADQDDDQNRH